MGCNIDNDIDITILMGRLAFDGVYVLSVFYMKFRLN